MGGQSDKKIMLNKQKMIGFYLYPTIGGSILYLLSNLYSGDIFTIGGFITILFVQFVSYFCFKTINDSLGLGLPLAAYSTYLDILVVNIIVEVGTLFTDYFYYVYCIFPGYLFYKLMSLCWGYATNIEYVDDGKGQKKKKEKKEKVKYVK